MTMLDQRTIQG